MNLLQNNGLSFKKSTWIIKNSWNFTITERIEPVILLFYNVKWNNVPMWLVLRTIKGFINLWNNFFFLFMIKKTSTFIWINAFHIICPRSHFWRFLVSNRCCKTSLFSFVLFYLSRQIGFLHYVFIWVWISFLWFALAQRWWLQSWFMMIAVIFVYYSSKCSAAQF